MQNMAGEKTALGLDANVGAMLCYLPVCAINLIYSIIVIVTDKTNKTVRFHAFQSLLLIGAYIAVMVGLMVIGAVVSQISSGLGALFGLLPMVLVLGYVGLSVYGCVKGFQNGEFKLPVIGDMAEKWSNQ